MKSITASRARGPLAAAILCVGALQSVSAQAPQFAPLPGDTLPGPAPGTQDDADISPGNGQYLIVYEDERLNFAETVGGDPWEVRQSDVYATRVASDGSVIDTSPIAVDSSAYSQENPRAGFNGTDWLVAYESRSVIALGTGTSRDVVAVRVAGDGTVLDDDPIAIDVGDNEAFAPTVGSDGVNWFVTWTDGFDLFGCLIDAAGNIGTTITIQTAAFTYDTDIAFAQGRYLVVWEGGIKARIYDAALNPITSRFSISNWADDADPSVATDGTDFFVSWTYLDSYFPEVRGTIVKTDGTVVTPSGKALDGLTLDASSGTNTVWTGSSYLVAWLEKEYDLTTFKYRDKALFRTVDSQGNPLGAQPTTVVDSATLYTLWRVRMASLGQGDAYLGWMDTHEGTQRTFTGYGTIVDPAGGFGTIAPYTVAPPAQLWPDLALGPEGATAADDVNLSVFISKDDAESRVVYQRLDGNGVAIDPEPVVLAGGKDTFEHPAVAWNGSEFLVVWEEQLVFFPTGQIQGKRVKPDGTVLDAAPIVILDGNEPDVAAVGGNFYVVSSEEPQDDLRFIYGRRVRGSDGALLDATKSFIGSNYSLAPAVEGFDNSWLVMWHEHSTHDNPNSTLRAAFVLPGGQVQQPFLPTDGTTFYESYVDLTIDGDVATFAFSDRTNTRVRQMQKDGTLLGSPSGVIVTSGDDETHPTIAWDGGKFALTSVDYRDQFFLEPLLGDLFGTRLSSGLQALEPAGLAIAANPKQPESEAAIRGRDGKSIVLYPAILDDFGNWRVSVGTWSDWQPLGFGLAGSNGVPELEPMGIPLQGETPVLEVSSGPPNAVGIHILADDPIFVPFRGGTIVPNLETLIGFTTDGAGNASTSLFVGNPITAGLTFYVQSWIFDPGAPQGFAATQAFSTIAP